MYRLDDSILSLRTYFFSMEELIEYLRKLAGTDLFDIAVEHYLFLYPEYSDEIKKLVDEVKKKY